MKVLQSDEVQLLWNFSIQIERRIEHKPDIVVFQKKQKACIVIDVACPFGTRIKKKEQEKIGKGLNKEVAKFIILPIIIGALGSVTKNLRKNPGKLDLNLGLDALQKTCLLGTARIFRKVLDTM